jgi:hypothetical protein
MSGKTPEQSSFYEPFLSLPASIPAETKAELQAEAKGRDRGQGLPRPTGHCCRSSATNTMPRTTDGARRHEAAEWRCLLSRRRSANTPRSRSFAGRDPPDRPQAEVAKIRARMNDVMKEAGFTGDLPPSSPSCAPIRSSMPKTPDELLMRAAWISKKFDGKAKYFFGRLPRSRFEVIPVPDDIAPFYTAGRGGTGVYLVNTYNLPSRALYSLPALTLHESAPGHAFQMPLADEQDGMPDFRRKTYISAFGEGWALYCELLGEEMGMYETPYEVFGMLSYQMWRAARLVVDTGIHAKGWTREQGQAVLPRQHRAGRARDHHRGRPLHLLAWDRRSATILARWPSSKARAKAEAALGDKFNIRRFHDARAATRLSAAAGAYRPHRRMDRRRRP